MKNLVINDDLKSLLPPLSDEELAGLEDDILKNGCLSDLIVWDDILIDGYNRHAICTKRGISFGIKKIAFESLDDAKLWILKNQGNRRNLTPFRRAELALKHKDIIAAKAKERQRAAGGDKSKGALPPILAEASASQETRKELAKIAGISHGNLSKIEYIIKHADDETLKKLREGETTTNKEYTRLRSKMMPQKKGQPSPSETDGISQRHDLEIKPMEESSNVGPSNAVNLKSPKKPDKEPPVYAKEYRTVMNLTMNGDLDGRKAEHYIEIIPRYAEFLAELCDMLNRLPGLIVTTDQQQAAQTAVQSVIESCNQCQQAACTFMQKTHSEPDSSSQVPHSTIGISLPIIPISATPPTPILANP